jgi:hypothetical protein
LSGPYNVLDPVIAGRVLGAILPENESATDSIFCDRVVVSRIERIIGASGSAPGEDTRGRPAHCNRAISGEALYEEIGLGGIEALEPRNEHAAGAIRAQDRRELGARPTRHE